MRDETNLGGVVRHFYYNEQWQCLEERANEGGAATRQYVWHPHYIDALALTYDGATKRYYAQDANFNVTAVLDGSGDVVERYAYTPYGEATVLDANYSADADNKSDIGNEFLYTGRRRDPETGLQYNRNRYYHQQLGRWLTRDPIGYEGSQWNLYEYVGGSPLSDSDPFGQRSRQDCLKKLLSLKTHLSELKDHFSAGHCNSVEGVLRDFLPGGPCAHWADSLRGELWNALVIWNTVCRERLEKKYSYTTQPEFGRRPDPQRTNSCCEDGLTTGDVVGICIGTGIIVFDIITVPSGEGAVGVIIIRKCCRSAPRVAPAF